MNQTEKLVELFQDLFHFVEINGKVVDGFRSREIVLELKQALKSYKDGWVSVDTNKTYFPVSCEVCGWFGSSEYLEGGGQIADTGDHDDCYCPICLSAHDCSDGEEKYNLNEVMDRFRKLEQFAKKQRELALKLYLDLEFLKLPTPPQTKPI